MNSEKTAKETDSNTIQDVATNFTPYDTSSHTGELLALDAAHVWHPFTPMKQWREQPQLIIERGQGCYLFDTDGRRYIDGTSSLWCNVHGHRVPAIDQAIRNQLDLVAHSTLLGLANEPSIRFAAKLVQAAPAGLNKVFYSDAGATAVEVAFKMAVGYWHHRGREKKTRFIGLEGAYHGDTTGSMSVGYSDLFHRPFVSMVFPTWWLPSPDAVRAPQAVLDKLPADHTPSSPWPTQDAVLGNAINEHCLGILEAHLKVHAHETAAIVLEPGMQGAAGMIPQPAGFLKGVQKLARQYEVLVIADEVAVGFGRTGSMFACEHEGVEPDILCVAKGITGGYLPLAATLMTDEIEAAFTGELADRRTLYHGHTYTGNPLACAAALASLQLFETTDLLERINTSATLMEDRLETLKGNEHVLDVRQRGIMAGIELCASRTERQPFDFSKRTAAALCHAMRDKGLIIRPLGDVIVLMPIPAMPQSMLHEMLDIVIETIENWQW